MMQLVVASYGQEDLPLLDEVISLRRHKSLSQGTLEEIAQATGFRCIQCDQPIDCRQFPDHRKRWLACTVEGPEQSVQLLQLLMKWGISSLESCASLNEFCQSRQVSCYSCNQSSSQQSLPDYLKINWREAIAPAYAVIHEETVVTTSENVRPASAARSNSSAQVDPTSAATHKSNSNNTLLNVKQEPVDDYSAHIPSRAGPHASTSSVNPNLNTNEQRETSSKQNGNYANTDQYVEEKPLPILKRSPQRQENYDENTNRGVNLAHKDVLKGYILARTMDLVPAYLLKQPHIKTELQDNDNQSRAGPLEDPPQSNNTPIPAATATTSNVSLRSLLVQQAKVAPLPTKDTVQNNAATEEHNRRSEKSASEDISNENALKRPRPVAPPFPRRTKPLEPAMSDTASTTSSAPSQSSFVEPWSLDTAFTTVSSMPVKGGFSITCKVCKRVIKVRQSIDYDFKLKQIVIAHVLRHMKHEVYSCSLCDFDSNFKPSITRHLEKEHARIPAVEYEDRTKRPEFKEETEALLHKCFVVQH